MGRASAVVTVNEPLSRVLQQRYRPKRIVVVHNTPARWDALTERPDYLHRALSIAPEVPVVLYHGDFSPGRGPVQLAEAMLTPGLERAHLASVGFEELADELAALSREPRFGGRI